MSAGILLVTHCAIGTELLKAATAVLAGCPLRATALQINLEDERDAMIDAAHRLATKLDDGDGLLVLTDLYGSTPSNIANALASRHRVRVLTGVNLPMLVRALNYAALPLEQLADKALAGGHDGLVLCPHARTDAESGAKP
jgi:PTS system ascorbate-specific IIA component